MSSAPESVKPLYIARRRPSISEAVFVRLVERPTGEWSVEIYTPDGWFTYLTEDTEKQAEEVVAVLIRQHHLQTRSPVRLSGSDTTPPTPRPWDAVHEVRSFVLRKSADGQPEHGPLLFQDGLSLDQLGKALCEGGASDTERAIQVSGSRWPKPTEAMLVRAAELSDGTWSVELRMQEGWRTYSTGFTQQEAELAAQALCVRHRLPTRSPLFQPKPESETPTP